MASQDKVDPLKVPACCETLVVPSYGESPASLQRLLGSVPKDVLVIWVINRSADAPSDANAASLRWLAEMYPAIGDQVGRATVRASGARSCVVVDCDSAGSTLRSGVGEARRIGCKLAMDLSRSGSVPSDWLHTTDADSILPPGFFDAPRALQREDSVACIRGRCTTPIPKDSPWHTSTVVNEISGVMGTVRRHRARCPWSFRASGCGVSFTVDAYEQCGGFDPCDLAEDIYLLNELGKLGRIHRVVEPRVQTDPRPVGKCVQGYGYSLRTMQAEVDEGKQIVVTSPKVWDHFSAVYDVLWDAVTRCVSLEASCDVAGRSWGCDAGLIRRVILEHIGPVDLMCRAWGGGKEAYQGLHSICDVFISVHVVEHLRSVFGTVPLAEGLHAFGWDDPSDLDGAMAYAYAVEAKECVRDAGVWFPDGVDGRPVL